MIPDIFLNELQTISEIIENTGEQFQLIITFTNNKTKTINLTGTINVSTDGFMVKTKSPYKCVFIPYTNVFGWEVIHI